MENWVRIVRGWVVPFLFTDTTKKEPAKEESNE